MASTAPLRTMTPEVSFKPLVRVSARNGIASAMVAQRTAKPGSSCVPAGAPSAASRSRARVTMERPSGVSSRIDATSAAVRAELKNPVALLALLGFVLIVALNYRKVIGGTLIADLRCDRDWHSVRPRALFRHRVAAAVDQAVAAAARLLARARRHLPDRRVLDPVHRRVRQRRHADRRHPPHRTDEGRQARAHEGGADLGLVRPYVRRGDRHIDDDELHRERGRRLGRRPHRTDRGFRVDLLPSWRCCSPRSPA